MGTEKDYQDGLAEIEKANVAEAERRHGDACTSLRVAVMCFNLSGKGKERIGELEQRIEVLGKIIEQEIEEFKKNPPEEELDDAKRERMWNNFFSSKASDEEWEAKRNEETGYWKSARDHYRFVIAMREKTTGGCPEATRNKLEAKIAEMEQKISEDGDKNPELSK